MAGDHDRAEPVPGAVDRPSPGLRRILAPNPSPMTLHGTNTYLLGTGRVTVIDPGPEDPRHLAAILAALDPGERIETILVTHAHRDHSPLAGPLARATGAPVLARGNARAGRRMRAAYLLDGAGGGGEGVDTPFAPDRCLPDGAVIDTTAGPLEALWTPGHFGNHMCFVLDGAVFTGDLVMGWASSLISPPDGDLGDYMASLSRLARLVAGRSDWVLHPGHGAAVLQPQARIAALADHRRARGRAIAAALAAGPMDCASLTARLYADTPAALHPAAARNVLAHLIEMHDRGEAAPLSASGSSARIGHPPLWALTPR